MWIEGSHVGRPAGSRRSMGVQRCRRAVGSAWMLLLMLLLVGCGQDGGAAVQEGVSAVSAEEASPAPAAMAGTAMSAPAAEPGSVADLFPEGEGKQLVLANCASCHAVACSVMGQRTAARWAGLKEAHREHVPGLSDAEREVIFAYLSSNFSDAQPEPVVPPSFIQAGCTPF